MNNIIQLSTYLILLVYTRNQGYYVHAGGMKTSSKQIIDNREINPKGPFQIGDLHRVSISHNDFNANPDGKSLSFTLTHENASFLSIHYKKLDLPHGCSVTLTDENGGEEYTSTDKGLFDLGTFWAHHINSNTMIITLKCKKSGHMKNAVIDIDKYTAGFPIEDKFEINQRSLSTSICGKDDKRNAICYKNNHSSEYGKSKAVARLLINGRGACTGWLVGRNLLLTNHHCIDSLSDVQNTDFEFMAEESVCSSSRDGSWFSHRSTAIYDGVALVAKDKANDFALIRMENNLGDTYGFFELDNRRPNVGEAIYIPQHPGGRPKEMAIYDSNESGGRCKVKQLHRGGCTGSANAVRYSCDTEGGTSGSPVVSASTNKVVALHNCGGACNGNMGVPVTDFYSQISEYLSNDTNNNDDIKDEGYRDSYRGWYDATRSGRCNDYCRWVGNSGSGGNPAHKTSHGSSWWSCLVAGTGQQYSPKNQFGSRFTKLRCKYQGANPSGTSTCSASKANIRDAGYSDSYRGWYDVTGCGKCNDYCRWVGNSGPGGNPVSKTQHGSSWWSCAMSGTDKEYSPKHFFLGAGFSSKKCTRKGAVSNALNDITDQGYRDSYRGWYDATGSGKCNDYCRWVGNSGSGGNPAHKTSHGSSWWSCLVAGTGQQYSPKNRFGSKFTKQRCKYQGANPRTCSASKANIRDAGYSDSYRGWYDVTGCGKCNDYCRWVGNSGPGGNPVSKTQHGSSWWSCAMSGTDKEYSPKHFFLGAGFSDRKCSNKGAPSK